MSEYSDRVKADIRRDNTTRKFLYLIFAVTAGIAVFLLGGFATAVALLGLGPVLLLIAIIEIYCRAQNWRRLRAAKEADLHLDKSRPKYATVNVVSKLRSRERQARDLGEPALASDLRLAIATLERLDHEVALSPQPVLGKLASEPIEPI
jgi:hypothetical protein